VLKKLGAGVWKFEAQMLSSSVFFVPSGAVAGDENRHGGKRSGYQLPGCSVGERLTGVAKLKVIASGPAVGCGNRLGSWAFAATGIANIATPAHRHRDFERCCSFMIMCGSPWIRGLSTAG
jgi:hypothetical protein